MRLFHFVSAKYGVTDIENRRLKIATFSNLNDPFELHGFAIPQKKDRLKYEGWVHHMSETYGLLCFSESWKNPVQWSHYADNHRGLCLEFEIPDRFPQKVSCVSERRRLDLQKDYAAGLLNTDFIIEALSSKYLHWQYEQEWRLFLGIQDRESIDGLYFESFGTDMALKKVFIGAMSDLSSVEIKAALGSLSKTVQIITTRLSFHNYEICIQKELKRQK